MKYLWYGLNSIEEYKDTNNKNLQKITQQSKIIQGRGWSTGSFSRRRSWQREPKKEHLDEVSKEIPIILRAYDGHTIWLNSKAMEVFNIDLNTPCPAGGKIEINYEKKELWGTLKESAMDLISDRDYSR